MLRPRSENGLRNDKGFEVMHALGKGQASAFNITRDIRGDVRFIERAVSSHDAKGPSIPRIRCRRRTDATNQGDSPSSASGGSDGVSTLAGGDAADRVNFIVERIYLPLKCLDLKSERRIGRSHP